MFGITGARLIAQLSILFGLLSLLLGCTGLFGIMAYSVGRRTREIGIRIAVGGQPHNVVWSVVSEALLLVMGGSLIGISGPVAQPVSAVALVWVDACRWLVDSRRYRDYWIDDARCIDYSGPPGHANRSGDRAPLRVAPDGDLYTEPG